MNSTDKKILRLIQTLQYQNKIKNDTDFCSRISLLPQSMTKIKNGTAHFTVSHLKSICKEFNVNANWILGTDIKAFNDKNSIEITEF
jgi:DNA-binding Xre family transcriptional regulator